MASKKEPMFNPVIKSITLGTDTDNIEKIAEIAVK